jgi:biotin carboxyl carrier protein
MLDAVRLSNRPELIIHLCGEVLAQTRFELAAGALVTGLAERFGFDRVSVGLYADDKLRVVACSHGMEVAQGADANELLAAAMYESIEQAVSLRTPGADAGPDWVTLAHENLRQRVGGGLATVPLAAGGEALGAITFERATGVIAPAELAELEHLLGLIAPVLKLMRRNERGVRQWLAEGLRAQLRRFRALDAHRLRAVTAGLAAALLLLLVLPVTERVRAPARLEGEVQRVLVAPTDSYLKVARVRPGDRVRAGQVLAELMDQDLMLERERWASQLAQHETAYGTAMSRSDRAEAAVHLAQASEAQSQLELVEQEIARASIVAPFDGIVIQGDLSQAVGAPVRQGDTLFTIAPGGSFRVIAEVDERDIAQVAVGQSGSLALSALPWDTVRIIVKRITPLATATGGRNVFEVEAALSDPPPGLRPGLSGSARIEVGRRPLAVGWAEAAAARVRLFFWAWLP